MPVVAEASRTVEAGEKYYDSWRVEHSEHVGCSSVGSSGVVAVAVVAAVVSTRSAASEPGWAKTASDQKPAAAIVDVVRF